MNETTEEQVRERAKADGITHISTGAAILQGGKILTVRRAPDDFLGGYYELPGGGVDDGETIGDAAFREVREETGLVPIRTIAIFQGFDYSTDRKPKVRQINFLVEVEAGDVTLSEEHDDFLWVDRNSLPKLKTTDNMRTCLLEAFSTAEADYPARAGSPLHGAA